MTGAARHHLSGVLVGVTARAVPPDPHPGLPPADGGRTDGGRLRSDTRAPRWWPWSARPPRGSRSWPSAWPSDWRRATGGRARVELVSVDSMAVYRGMDIGTAKPTGRRSGPRCAYHLVDLVDPSEEFTVHAVPAAAARPWAASPGGATAALLVGGTGLYLRSVVDDLTFPGRFPEVAAALERRARRGRPAGSADAGRPARPPRRLAELDPVAAARIEPANRRRLVRALEVTLGSGRPFSSFGPGLGAVPADTGRPGRDRTGPRTSSTAGSPSGSPASWTRACWTRSAAWRPAPGGCPGRPARRSATASCWPTSRTGCRWTRRWTRPSGGPGPSPGGSWAWFRRDPRIVWMDPDGDPVGAIVARLGKRPGHRARWENETAP